MFVEFHDLDGNDLFVNFGAVLYVSLSETGSTLHFKDHTLEIRETITDIKRNFQLMAMQSQLAGKLQ